jgi:hypothetical protein
MDGTVIPFAVTVTGAPFAYLGGGGRTLGSGSMRISAAGTSACREVEEHATTYNIAGSWRGLGFR